MQPANGARRLDHSVPADPAATYALALGGSIAAVLVAAAARRWLGLADLSLVFMLAVLVVAAKTRTGPAVATALLCFLGYNFFFIEPYYTLLIHSPQGVATVVLFLAAALLAGRLASRLAMQVDALRTANQHALARQELAQSLAVATHEGAVIAAAEQALQQTLDAQVWVRIGDRVLPGAEDHAPPMPVLRRIEGIGGGAGQAETIEEHGWWFLPLRASQQLLGAIGLKLPAHVRQLDEPHREVARAISDDVAQALLRIRLVADLQAERLSSETERLRSALLSSVSHDLRTPLAAIIGAADSLDCYGAAMTAQDRHDLLDTIRSEGERLDRYIQNLLDMTRLGHGTLALARDWIGVDELVGSAVGRMQRYQPGTRFTVIMDDDLAPVWVHPAFVEQALFNVIENAARFSPDGAAVEIHAHASRAGELCIEVRDHGPGIPEQERARIFDRFYRVERGDRGHQGTGLGLAICRGMIEAHGGEVDAHAGEEGRGTLIRIRLPHPGPSGDSE